MKVYLTSKLNNVLLLLPKPTYLVSLYLVLVLCRRRKNRNADFKLESCNLAIYLKELLIFHIV